MAWLKDHVKKLEATASQHSTEIKKIASIEPEIYNEFQSWTPLKLILLNYALDVCTLVIRSNPIFKEKYFVDLFAGSGINKIKDKKDFLIGSPFIASLNFLDDYTEMIFCEQDPELFKALELRVKSLNKKNLFTINCDCNTQINQIIPKINKKGVYSLFFIDPSNTEFSWSSMSSLLNIRTDIIFNFMCNQIRRTIGLFHEKGGGEKQLTEFFGDDSWKQWKSGDGDEELVNIYIQNIIKVRPDAMVKLIKIHSEKHGFCYFLLFITSKTKGNNPWLKGIDKAKEEIESNSDKSIEMALDIIKKRQTTLF